MEATKHLIIFYGCWPWGDPQRMSKTIIHFPFSRRVTKILSVWPKTERLHRRFPRGLMCFRSSKHLPYLMSSIINKCMALIRLCLVGALELAVEAPGTSSSGDRIWVRRWDVAFEQMLDLLSAGLLYCDEKNRRSHSAILVRSSWGRCSLPAEGLFQMWVKLESTCMSHFFHIFEMS